MYRNPLRKIVARTPISDELTESTLYFLETLECGHQLHVFHHWYWSARGALVQVPPQNKRHRCPECGEAQLALKFQPPSPGRKKAA